jgi:hypothetical protein
LCNDIKKINCNINSYHYKTIKLNRINWQSYCIKFPFLEQITKIFLQGKKSQLNNGKFIFISRNKIGPIIWL